MTVISDVYFDVAVILSKMKITSNNFLLADDPLYFVYSSSFMLKMNFVLLLYLKFNQGCHG